MHVKKAVIFCGMPGSGKSIGVTVAKDLEIPVFVMGDVVREEVKQRQLPQSPQTLAQVMLELRKHFGPAIVAKRCIEKFHQVTTPNIVVDGARSEAEITVFKQALKHVTVVAVHSSPQIRFERLQKRGRADDVLTKKDFHERDARELDIGLGRVIAQAEVMIVNEDDLKELKTRVHQILKKEFGLV